MVEREGKGTRSETDELNRVLKLIKIGGKRKKKLRKKKIKKRVEGLERGEERRGRNEELGEWESRVYLRRARTHSAPAPDLWTRSA